MTVNALRPVNGGFSATAYTEDDLTLDPLTVLRCDDRVFRSVHIEYLDQPMLSIYINPY